MTRFVTALHSVIFAKESVKDAWHRIVRAEGQPDSNAAAITAANDLYKKPLADYPTEVPNSITWRGAKKGTRARHSGNGNRAPARR